MGAIEFEFNVDSSQDPDFLAGTYYYDVCVLCEPGFVPEPITDMFRDKTVHCIPKITNC